MTHEIIQKSFSINNAAKVAACGIAVNLLMQATETLSSANSVEYHLVAVVSLLTFLLVFKSQAAELLGIDKSERLKRLTTIFTFGLVIILWVAVNLQSAGSYFYFWTNQFCLNGGLLVFLIAFKSRTGKLPKSKSLKTIERSTVFSIGGLVASSLTLFAGELLSIDSEHYYWIPSIFLNAALLVFLLTLKSQASGILAFSDLKKMQGTAAVPIGGLIVANIMGIAGRYFSIQAAYYPWVLFLSGMPPS